MESRKKLINILNDMPKYITKNGRALDISYMGGGWGSYQECNIMYVLSFELSYNNKGGMTAIEITEALAHYGAPMDKKVVNNTLYRQLKPEGLVDMSQLGSNARPIWKIAMETSKVPVVIQNSNNNVFGNIHVLLDLGNVHDCLIPASEVLNEDLNAFSVTAYANRGCTAPGVSDYAENVNIDDMGRSNVLMIMYGIELLEKHSTIKLIIVSNDRLLESFVSLAEEKYSSADITLITGNKAWEELREYLE